MTTQETITFSCNGIEWTADWNDRNDTLCVSCSSEDCDIANGIDYTDWPSEKEVSEAVGVKVKFLDALQESSMRSECIYRRVVT